MATSLVLTCAALLLAPGALAYRAPRFTPRTSESQLDHPNLVAISTWRYADDCWKHRPVRKLALNEETARVAAELPGAGMNPENIQPFQTVLKDGFLKVTCTKDYLLSFGDKFGDGKFSYSLGGVSNVSIVHYTSIVPKEDQKPMSYEVCFQFCRTVPDMHNFGIHNGRDCYCAPYFKPMESDSSQCDAVCEGSPTQMCGGKVKSTIFSMHMCANLDAELKQAGAKASELIAALARTVATMKDLATDMQTAAAGWQGVLGSLGDPHVSDLMQAAKEHAGELDTLLAKKAEIVHGLVRANSEAEGLANTSLVDATVAAKAEALTSTMEKLSADAEDAMKQITVVIEQTSPVGSSGASKQYYPLMYFVDKAHQDAPATCTGSPAAKPLANITLDGCAWACDREVEMCVGFAFFSDSPSLCFLFQKFTDATYYTACSSGNSSSAASESFLQARAQTQNATDLPVTMCMAKLSKFEGTSIKPDPNGKCAGCLKTATPAARCPKAP